MPYTDCKSFLKKKIYLPPEVSLTSSCIKYGLYGLAFSNMNLYQNVFLALKYTYLILLKINRSLKRASV